MVVCNVKKFMPSIYSKHNDRFLSRFTKKGKLKLFLSNKGDTYSDNKYIFIFSVNNKAKS